jgi:hypothetical protein
VTSNSQGSLARLRIGILIDDTDLPAWQLEMLRNIDRCEYADIALIVINGTTRNRKPWWRRFLDNRHRLLYLAYSALEERLTRSQTPSMCVRSCEELIENVQQITVTPESTRFVDRFPADDIERIKHADLDVIIRLGFRILKGDILQTPRYGIWSLHHGDNRVNRGMPPGFWEALEGWPTSGAVLQILSDELDGGELLFRSTSATNQPYVSRNLESYNWKAMLFIPRMLKRLHAQGPEQFFAYVRACNKHPDFYSGPLFTTPGNGKMMLLFLGSAGRFLWKKIRELFFLEQWQLLYCQSPSNGPALSMRRFKRLVPPKDRFWADPHVIDRNGESYVFFEELPFDTGKGHISVVRIDEHGTVSEPHVVLEKNYHLSYPFVFEHNGETYMIPETLENHAIELYVCRHFPDRWEFVMNLMEDVQAVDATVFQHEGRWWLLANFLEHPGVSPLDELFAFHADTFPTTDWLPHALNPVVSAVTSSRPAGPVFEHNGSLYRPSQNSAGRYGRATNLQEIVALTPDEYSERLTSAITPDWDDNLLGTHTLSFSDRLTVIDGEFRRFRLF